jgi:hypothetical protein
MSRKVLNILESLANLTAFNKEILPSLKHLHLMAVHSF